MSKFDIENRTIVRILLVIAAFVLVVMLAYQVRTELAWFGAAFFLAVALNPAVEFFARRFPRRSRGLAATTVFVIFLAIVGFLAYSLVPPAVSQTRSFIQAAPGYVQDIEQSHSRLGNLARQGHVKQRLQDLEEKLTNRTSEATSSVLTVVRSLFSGFAAVVTIFAVTIFMLLEGPGWMNKFWALHTPRRRKRNQKLAKAMYHAMTGYVTGNLLTSLIAAVLTSGLLAVLGVPYAIPLGLVVGILDLLPLIGASLGAVVVVLVALAHGVTAALVMLVFFLIYQQIENHIIQPIVYGRTIQMSPLLVTIAAIIGAALGGIMGAFVAIPIAASIKILIADYIEHDLNENVPPVKETTAKP